MAAPTSHHRTRPVHIVVRSIRCSLARSLGCNGVSSVEGRSNNSFKPNLLRYTKAMAEKACHGFGSTTQVGLTQALGCHESNRIPFASPAPHGLRILEQSGVSHRP